MILRELYNQLNKSTFVDVMVGWYGKTLYKGYIEYLPKIIDLDAYELTDDGGHVRLECSFQTKPESLQIYVKERPVADKTSISELTEEIKEINKNDTELTQIIDQFLETTEKLLKHLSQE